MARRNDRNLIVGLDIGTSKVVAIVGELTHEGKLEVVGLGSHPSRGLKRGVVVNIESTVQSIQRAVEEAELMAGCEIHSVYAGIAGSHVRSLNSHGIVAIRNKEVTSEDVDRVIEPYYHQWKPTDMIIWDNWRVLHMACGCDPKYDRIVHRTTIKGDYGLGRWETEPKTLETVDAMM